MPFIAERTDRDAGRDSNTLIPAEADSDMSLFCPKCDESMSYVDRHERENGVLVSSHFRHHPDTPSGGGDGGGRSCGGESPTHEKMESIAADTVCHEHDGPVADLHIDSQYLNGKLPDVLVEFASPTTYLGKGIAVECQYRHTDKDRQAAERAYLDAGYTTLWVDEDCFDLDLRAVDLSRGEWVTPWPNAVQHPDNPGYDAAEVRRTAIRHTALTSDGDTATIHFRNGSATPYPPTEVPATLHLDRWVRDRDTIPPVDQWGLDAATANYAFGNRATVPSTLSLGLHTPVHAHVTPLASRDHTNVTVPATFHLNRWTRDRDTIPPVDQWGLDATDAAYAFGDDDDDQTPLGWTKETETETPIPTYGHAPDPSESPDLDSVVRVRATMFPQWWADELHEIYEQARQNSSSPFLERFDHHAPYDIRCPPHPHARAREIIAGGRLCDPGDHDWIELVDGYYWQECRACGIADVTAADIGQNIVTPNAELESGSGLGGGR